jgi:hypothetical protein
LFDSDQIIVQNAIEQAIIFFMHLWEMVLCTDYHNLKFSFTLQISASIIYNTGTPVFNVSFNSTITTNPTINCYANLTINPTVSGYLNPSINPVVTNTSDSDPQEAQLAASAYCGVDTTPSQIFICDSVKYKVSIRR